MAALGLERDRLNLRNAEPFLTMRTHWLSSLESAAPLTSRADAIRLAVSGVLEMSASRQR